MLQKTSNTFLKRCCFTAFTALALSVNSAFAIIPAIGWSNITVSDINNLGHTSGIGIIEVTTSVFLLTSNPEPETYAKPMAGFGVMGFAASRRKSSERSSNTLREVMPARLNVEGA